MRHFSLIILTAVTLIIAGAGCGKKATTNTTAPTNTSSGTNTITNTGTTTGTFSTNSSATNTSPTATATLTFTSNGVSPKTLTVASGTVVTIVNNDSQAHEIASNPHPSHSDLPGFDKSISAGSSASFTFTKVGSWGYHDHNNPFESTWKGTVIVQ